MPEGGFKVQGSGFRNGIARVGRTLSRRLISRRAEFIPPRFPRLRDNDGKNPDAPLSFASVRPPLPVRRERVGVRVIWLRLLGARFRIARLRKFASMVFFFFIFAPGLLAGCGRDTVAKSDTRPVIVATIFPLQSIVGQLTGDWANVELLMPPGSSPHDFEPQPAQMEPLSRADLLVEVGLNLDGWADRAAQQVARKDLRVIRMAGSTPAEVTRAMGRNPHLWMDPAYTKDFVGVLAEALAQQYPAHSADIAARAQTLQHDLDKMDEAFRRQLTAVPVKEFVSYHNAYDPLATRYGLARWRI